MCTGAGLFGVVLTWLLPTTLEDLLAASLAGLAGYVALLNLPLRRSEAKGKLQRSADAFLQVQQTMIQQAAPVTLTEFHLNPCSGLVEGNAVAGMLKAAPSSPLRHW